MCSEKFGNQGCFMHHDNSPGHTAFSAQHTTMLVLTHPLLLRSRPLCLLLFPKHENPVKREKVWWYHGDSTWITAVLSGITERGLKNASSSGRGAWRGVWISKGKMQACFQVKHKMFIVPESENFCLAILKNSSSSDENHTYVETAHLLFFWEDFAFSSCV
jgi:hypothetical protein